MAQATAPLLNSTKRRQITAGLNPSVVRYGPEADVSAISREIS